MYKDYDDQELLYLIGENNEDANNILYEKYKHIIDLKVKKYVGLVKSTGLDYNDLFQEGMVGLSEAIQSYKDNKDTKFSSFANICIERQLLTAITGAKRKKHAYLNDSYSLDNSIDEDGRTLIDFISDYREDPSIMVENAEYNKNLKELIYNKLSDFEREVFDLKLAGLEYKEIASILNKSYKSIDTALQRIRLKVKDILKSKQNID